MTTLNHTKIRTNILVTAVQNSLVTSFPFADGGESVDDLQPDLLPLLFLVDRDVFDVTNETKSTQKFTFDEDASDADDGVRCLVYDDQRVVRVWARALAVELLHPRLLSKIADDSQDRKNLEMTTPIIGRCQRADLCFIPFSMDGGASGTRMMARTWRSECKESLTSRGMSSEGKRSSSSESGVKGMLKGVVDNVDSDGGC